MTAHVLLAHGASGGPETMRPHVEGLARRGVAAREVALPRGRAEAALPAYLAQVDDPSQAVIGGHSFGGRVASLAAVSLADERGPVRGVVLLSYPLHRPGAPETWAERTRHWARLDVPVLVLSGESDPFARLDLLRSAVRLLPQAELVSYPRVRHGLGPVLDDALDRVAAFVRYV